MSDRREKTDLRAARSRRGPIRIGEWVLHPDLGVLRKDGKDTRLNSKALHVLLVLLDAGDKGVSRDVLLDKVWGENYPGDAVISRAMADLRSAFGERAGDQKYIRTLPKFGYQFVARHSRVDAEHEAANRRVLHVTRYRRHYLLAVALAFAAMMLAQFLQSPPPAESAVIVLSGQRPLTSAPGLEHQPRIVPGGDWVVYAVMRRDRNDWDLFRVSIADGASQPVAVTPGIHEHGPAISPIGDELAYVRFSPSGCDVVVQSIALGVPDPVTACTGRFPTLIDWSPTGNWLAYTISQQDEPDGLRRIYLVNRFSRETRRLTSDVTPTGTDFYPRFSPSGRRLAFLRGEPQPDHRTTLWLVDLDTGAETRLTETPAQLGGMAWVDEHRLVYSVSEAGRMRGRSLNMESGELHPIDSIEFVHPEYSIADNLLVTTELKSDRDLALLSPSGIIRALARSTSDDHQGVLSPDEKWLAFISRRSGFDELWIAASADNATRRLTRFDGAAVRYPDWHPEGQKLLVTAQTGAGERLYEIDIVSGASRLIETGFDDVTTPTWLPGGDSWVAGCRDASGWGICIGRAGTVERIADGYYRPEPSTNETVYVVDDAGVLYSLSTSDGSVTELWDALPGNGRYGWAVDDNMLYFLAGGDTGNTARLLKRDLLTGDVELLYNGPMPVADVTISIGRQSKAVLFTRFQTSSDDLAVYDDINF